MEMLEWNSFYINIELQRDYLKGAGFDFELLFKKIKQYLSICKKRV
jgi:hypothetical protein